MKVRLQLGSGRRVLRQIRKNRPLALGFAGLLAPAVLAAYVLGVWRLCTDVGIAGDFEIKQGLFSHWQVWIAVGAAGNALSVLLNRYGHGQPLRPGAARGHVDQNASQRM